MFPLLRCGLYMRQEINMGHRSFIKEK